MQKEAWVIAHVVTALFHAQPFPNLSGALRAAVARVVLHARALGERALC